MYPHSPANTNVKGFADVARLARMTAAAVGVLVVVLWFGVSVAFAEEHYGYIGGFGGAGSSPSDPYPLSAPAGVGVAADGDFYVSDPANHWLQAFGPSGELLWIAGKEVNRTKVLAGLATEAEQDVCSEMEIEMGSVCQPGAATGSEALVSPGEVAVDNAGSGSDPSDGDVYVVDAGSGTIDKFSAEGELKGELPELEAQAQVGGLAGVATDPSGDVWSYANNGTAVEFSDEGLVQEPPSPFFTGHEDGLGIAVDGAGHMALVTTFEGAHHARYLTIPEGGGIGYDGILGGEPERTDASGVAIDDADGEVFMDQGNEVVRYQVNGEGHPVEAPIEPVIVGGGLGGGGGRGIAVSNTGTVFVANSKTGVVEVFALGNPPEAPQTLPATGVTASAARLHGELDPHGASGKLEYQFDYNLGAPCAAAGHLSAPVPPGKVAQAREAMVEVEVAGLEPHAEYRVCAVAVSPFGQPTGGEESIETAPAPPAIVSENTLDIAGSSARLGGRVNPDNQQTSYEVQVAGNPALVGARTLAGATAIPPGFVAPGVLVSVPVEGLAPQTTYYYRLIATNAGHEEEAGPVESFTTEAACTNTGMEGVEAYLPDCRAYEMVTPAFKNGLAVRGFSGVTGGITAIPADGNRLIGETIGGFAGSEGNQNRSFYEFMRTPHGWVTSPITAPATRFAIDAGKGSPFGGVFASANGERTLWDLAEPSQSFTTQDLYVREADGAFVEVGPITPPADNGPPAGATTINHQGPYEFGGASSDLSHVLFIADHVAQRLAGEEPEALLWPGDTTRLAPAGEFKSAHSLYEYVGAGNTKPELVGVSDGSTVVEGEGEEGVEGRPLREGRLISSCSTDLGSGPIEARKASADTYNAVSASGETVFFTAEGHAGVECPGGVPAPPVDEVYARVDGLETVPVSEPTRAQCRACQTASKAAAEFRGASEDGSKVFFTTEQELLPGATGKNLYEYDFDNPAGEKVLRVSEGSSEPQVQGVARVSEDGSHVYFVAKGVLSAQPRGGGCAVLTPSLCRPVVGANNLYVYERDTGRPNGHVAFVATLSSAPSGTLPDSDDWQPTDERPVQATPDGQFLVFDSRADLTIGDESSEPQVFEYDAASEELVRVSAGQAGYSEGEQSSQEHGSTLPVKGSALVFDEEVPGAGERGLAVSSDGSVVAFDSAAALTEGGRMAQDRGVQSVYEYRSHGPIADGDVHLISDGVNGPPDNMQEFFGEGLRGLDASGGDVFFETPDALLASDSDTAYDVYDARVDGGFPAAVAGASCVGEACQGVASEASPFISPLALGAAATATGPAGPAVGGAPASVGSRPQPLSLAQKLAKALKACRSGKERDRRHACEARARKRYRPPHKANKALRLGSKRSER